MIIKLSLFHYFPSILVDIVFCLKILLLAEIRKVLFKIAKEKDCEALNEWIKPCENHLHWSATSTYDGNNSIIILLFIL